MIRPIPGIDYAALVMTGQKPFPTFNKERKGEGFKEVLDREMEENDKRESLDISIKNS